MFELSKFKNVGVWYGSSSEGEQIDEFYKFSNIKKIELFSSGEKFIRMEVFVGKADSIFSTMVITDEKASDELLSSYLGYLTEGGK